MNSGAHIPGIDHEEPEFWLEDDIPKSDADEREERERAAAADRARESDATRDNARQ